MKKYVNITKDSVVNRNDKVKWVGTGEKREYYVVDWIEEKQRYRLQDVTNYLEEVEGVSVLASSGDLIENFQIEVDVN